MKRVLALVLLTGAVFAGRAEAAVISIQPNVQFANVGDTVNFDVFVSLGPTEAVGGVSLRIAPTNVAIWDCPTVTCDSGFAIDPDDKMGAEFDFGSGFGATFIDFVFLAEDYAPLDQFTELKADQGAGFRIATFSLLALAEGVSEINFVNEFGAYLSNEDGITPLSATVDNGLVCVGTQFAARCQVPEPGLLSLLAAGLVTAAVRRRQSKR